MCYSQTDVIAAVALAVISGPAWARLARQGVESRLGGGESKDGDGS